jgi:hypothetical protein
MATRTTRLLSETITSSRRLLRTSSAAMNARAKITAGAARAVGTEPTRHADPATETKLA